jgi:hypothetical protein
MEVTQALVRRATQQMPAMLAARVIEQEMAKGCSKRLYAHPVALQPMFRSVASAPDWLDNSLSEHATPHPAAPMDAMRRLRVWLHPKEEMDWLRAELFLQQLRSAQHRIALEVFGNATSIHVCFACHVDDVEWLKAAFRGQYPLCHIDDDSPAPVFFQPSAGGALLVADYVPPPPYWRLLTSPPVFRISPFEMFLRSIAGLPEPLWGFHQTVFQPVAHAQNLHYTVEMLTDFEFLNKLYRFGNAGHRYQHQGPSGDLRHMAMELERKAHNDKPFFCTAVRAGVSGPSYEAASGALYAAMAHMNLFQYGGRVLEYVETADYEEVLTSAEVRVMLLQTATYRPGFLTNSLELSGLVHLPPLPLLQDTATHVDLLDGFSPVNTPPDEGTLLGSRSVPGGHQHVRNTQSTRCCHAHLIGKPGTGKTTALEAMSFDDMNSGHGLCIIDPHGDLAERMLTRIPEDKVEKTLYFAPGAPDWVPLWNPLEAGPGQDLSRMADDLVNAFFKLFKSSWGHRLEHLLRHAIYGILHIPGGTLRDVSDLLTTNKESNSALRATVANAVNDELARRFWEKDIGDYRSEFYLSVHHKLSRVLVGGTLALTLSQPENRFHFRRMMDEGQILIVDLANLGSEARDTVGSLVLSLIYQAAMSRSTLPLAKRRVFHVYVDEAHRFLGGGIEDSIAETRKYGVNLNLASQYMSQYTREQSDALGVVGTTIVFNVLNKDAVILSKQLGEDVMPEDLGDLSIGDAIARIGTETVRLHTERLPPPEDPSVRDRIIARSLQRYYAPAETVRQYLKRRCSGRGAALQVLLDKGAPLPEVEEFPYDEF